MTCLADGAKDSSVCLPDAWRTLMSGRVCSGWATRNRLVTAAIQQGGQPAAGRRCRGNRLHPVSFTQWLNAPGASAPWSPARAQRAGLLAILAGGLMAPPRRQGETGTGGRSLPRGRWTTMMIWNASGVPVWQVAFVWAGGDSVLGACDLGWLRPHHAQALPSLAPPMGSGPRQRPSRRPRRGIVQAPINERHVRHPQCTGWASGRPAGGLGRAPGLSGAGLVPPTC